MVTDNFFNTSHPPPYIHQQKCTSQPQYPDAQPCGLHPVFLAAVHNATQILRFILLNTPDAVKNTAVPHGSNAAFFAASSNSLNALRVLSDSTGGQILTKRNKNGDSLLHTACESNSCEVVSYLCMVLNRDRECGNSIDALNAVNLSPLSISAIHGNPQCALILLQNGADPNLPTILGLNCIHLSAMSISGKQSGLEITKLLVAYRANVNDQKNSNRISPLHFAVAVNNIGLMNVLMENGANVDGKDKFGYSPLHVAAINNHLTAAMVMVQKGASACLRDDLGMTIIHIAACRNLSDFLLYALSLNQAKLDERESTTYNTPLLKAVENGSDKCVEILLRAGASTDLLNRAGESVDRVVQKTLARAYISSSSVSLSNGATTVSKMIDASKKGWGFDNSHLFTLEDNRCIAELLSHKILFEKLGEGLLMQVCEWIPRGWFDCEEAEGAAISLLNNMQFEKRVGSSTTTYLRAISPSSSVSESGGDGSDNEGFVRPKPLKKRNMATSINVVECAAGSLPSKKRKFTGFAPLGNRMVSLG